MIQKMEIASQKKVVFQFACGASRNIEMPLELPIPALPTAFRYVSANRHDSPTNLASYAEQFLSGK